MPDEPTAPAYVVSCSRCHQPVAASFYTDRWGTPKVTWSCRPCNLTGREALP